MKTSSANNAPSGVAALATNAWNTYYELIGIAAKNGFTVKDKGVRSVILKDPTSTAEISIDLELSPKK